MKEVQEETLADGLCGMGLMNQPPTLCMGRAEGQSPSALTIIPLCQRGTKGDWSGGMKGVGTALDSRLRGNDRTVVGSAFALTCPTVAL